MTQQTRMYQENLKSINWFVGCEHDCVYCKPSFQRQMKRQKNRCFKCFNYEPHAHLERLLKAPPKTERNDFVFFPSSGDMAFANRTEMVSALDYALKHQYTTFLMQSKNPICFEKYEYGIPPNVILATTIETNKTTFNTPSLFKEYFKISKAPLPRLRYNIMRNLLYPQKMVTIEPILDFDLEQFVLWIEEIQPIIAYVGYDNHNCKLPEPKLMETQVLIKELEKFTEVRVKTLRKAWYE